MSFEKTIQRGEIVCMVSSASLFLPQRQHWNERSQNQAGVIISWLRKYTQWVSLLVWFWFTPCGLCVMWCETGESIVVLSNSKRDHDDRHHHQRSRKRMAAKPTKLALLDTCKYLHTWVYSSVVNHYFSGFTSLSLILLCKFQEHVVGVCREACTAQVVLLRNYFGYTVMMSCS